MTKKIRLIILLSGIGALLIAIALYTGINYGQYKAYRDSVEKPASQNDIVLVDR